MIEDHSKKLVLQIALNNEITDINRAVLQINISCGKTVLNDEKKKAHKEV